MVLLLN